MWPILLIGANYMRTQWLAIAIMAVYLLGIAGVFALHQDTQEVLFFFRTHSFYVLFLAVMLAVPALQTESKSRRIVAVLSKGIHRWQYLGGILCGCGIITAGFSLLVGAITFVLCRRGGYPTMALPALIAALFGCCLLASAAGLFYSTFLHPLLASAATTGTLALPLIGASTGWRLRPALFPVAWFRTMDDRSISGRMRTLSPSQP